jgi:hypothetical protein
MFLQVVVGEIYDEEYGWNGGRAQEWKKKREEEEVG